MASVMLVNQEIGPLANELIRDPSKHLGHLVGCNLIYVLEDGWKGEKEFDFGRVSMKSHLAAVALDGRLREGEEVSCDNTEKLFLIEINKTLWQAMGQEPDADEMRSMSLYHLLCGCIVDDRGNLKVTQPDVRLFTEEIHVWGEKHPRIQALLRRLKSGSEGMGLLEDICLSAPEWHRAQAVADTLENPGRNAVSGRCEGLLEMEGGHAYLPLYWEVQNLGAGQRQRFYRAVAVHPQTFQEEAPGQEPELPFDKRFPTAGMLVLVGEDKEPYRVDPGHYRLLGPVEQVPQTCAMDLEALPVSVEA